MEKHITLLAVLNIVYRSLAIMITLVLVAFSMRFGEYLETLIRWESYRMHDFPLAILEIIPFVVCVIAIFVILVSAVGILGAIGVLKRKEWGRITLLVISFFNLIRVPLGTVLGIYGFWVLLNDQTVKLFNPVPGKDPGAAHGS